MRFVKFIKDFLLFFPVTFLFKPLSKSFLFLAYFNKLVSWIQTNRKQFAFSDFYSPVRNYTKRFQLYQYIRDHHSKPDSTMVYLEFGVAEGASFRWWLMNNRHAESRFFGFDTFEGLPEKWGKFYEKGDMHFAMPEINDQRGQLIKGLFQNTLNKFISEQHNLLHSPVKKVILMDADLYSATIYTLSQLYPALHKGDIILFDEFTVALHEFKAYTEFVSNFYIHLKPVAAVNNFYQVAFEVA